MDDMKIRGSMEPLGSALKLPKMSGAKSDGPSFADTLSESIKEVNGLQHDADRAVADLITGKSKSIHETMITLSKAELAFKMTMQIKNKVVEGYKEVLNTSL